MDDKFERQDSQYAFPYHYLPHFRGGTPSTLRQLGWGLEYLCYQQVVIERVTALAPRSVLDVGCGDGRFLGALAGVPRRLGVDLSDTAIRFARAFHPGIQFEVADVATLAEQFDVVTSIETLEHVPDEAVGGFLTGLAARCRPGGRVLVCVPTTNAPLHPKHHRHYDLALFERQLASSGAAMRIVAHEFVFRRSRLLRGLRRATSNRLWTVEIGALQRLMWQHVRTHLQEASAADGLHLVVTLEA